MDIDENDLRALRKEKYEDDPSADMSEDLERLAKGEPLAYVIGHMPFLGLTIDLTSHPLIPRPETEWWTEELVKHISENSVQVLDLCAGSGAIGLAVLKHCPNVDVTFSELESSHTLQIQKNVELNNLDASRAHLHTGDLFSPLSEKDTFNIIATNPPYIPSIRSLPLSVTSFEPSEALLGGADGLDVIRRILQENPLYLKPRGELWMECDISNIEQASVLAMDHGASYTKIRTDQYGRPRLLVAYY